VNNLNHALNRYAAAADFPDGFRFFAVERRAANIVAKGSLCLPGGDGHIVFRGPVEVHVFSVARYQEIVDEFGDEEPEDQDAA
jgi:hypothetical protein